MSKHTDKGLDVLIFVGIACIAVGGLSVTGLIGWAAWEVIQFVRECK